MKSDDFYISNNIETFEIEKISEVLIIDKIKIDKRLYGRFDIIINKYYRGRMDLLPSLYAFNNITDPVEVLIGRIINLPNIDSLESHSKINNIFIDDNIPGVSKSMNNKSQNNTNKKQNSKTKTTAVPKLNITVNVAKYDKTTGNIII